MIDVATKPEEVNSVLVLFFVDEIFAGFEKKVRAYSEYSILYAIDLVIRALINTTPIYRTST